MFRSTLGSLLLVACTSSTLPPLRKPDGSWHLKCGAMMAECVKQADDLCKGRGYVVLSGMSKRNLYGAELGVSQVEGARSRTRHRVRRSTRGSADRAERRAGTDQPALTVPCVELSHPGFSAVPERRERSMVRPEQISVDDPSFWHRLQFGFTIVYHYLFPQLTMGLAFIILLWKWRALRQGDPRYDLAARFWSKIFGINFVLGVITGVPMEFQFGTNWARFSRYAAGVIGQTLAMEGMFAFFLESAFVAALVFGERKLSRRQHFGAAFAVWAGSWLSGYFIVATNAFMQHPTGHALLEGALVLERPFQFLFNPWAIAQYLHTMMASVVTGSFVVSAVGAFYLLRGQHREQALLYLKWGTRVGLAASLLVAFPTGDRQAKLVAESQPVTPGRDGGPLRQR